MNLFEEFHQGLAYADFVARYANDGQKQRWGRGYDQVALTPDQRELLAGFRRAMPVLCLAGAWCGDCINQCPIFEHFAAAAPVIQVRYLDRDDHAQVQRALQINGGNRVPVVVFFSEDGFEVARYGERTLSKYRQMVRDQVGEMCPTGLALPGDPMPAQVTRDWLEQFERVQWILRLSPRLRQIHGD
ncbi:MAG TPA: thioredoxin family protein [Gemmataceae bacterium]|jgi:thiol-disulfide isomerase/thioredoxin|nr:thioredoxin family protein [Gemmataceae bacterium]